MKPFHDISFHCRYDMDSLDNGAVPTDKGKPVEKSLEDLSRSASNSPTHSASKSGKGFAVRWESQFCVLC